MSEPLLTMAHIQEAKRRYGGFCTPGTAAWFKRYGMDFRHLLRHGYPVSKIEALNDPFGNRVAAICREQAQEGGEK